MRIQLNVKGVEHVIIDDVEIVLSNFSKKLPGVELRGFLGEKGIVLTMYIAGVRHDDSTRQFLFGDLGGPQWCTCCAVPIIDLVGDSTDRDIETGCCDGFVCRRCKALICERCRKCHRQECGRSED